MSLQVWFTYGANDLDVFTLWNTVQLPRGASVFFE